MNTYAETQQRARDLRAQLAELSGEDKGDQEMLFQEWSPGRKMQRLWSMLDGMEISIPRYMVMGAITKRLPDGRFAFTANKDEAPVFKEGNVRCFLAEDSPERKSGLLEAAGLDHLPACPARGLRSAFSKKLHGEHRHSDSWRALEDYRSQLAAEQDREERQKQVDAMLQLAGSKAPEPRVKTIEIEREPVVCDECGGTFKTPLALAGHKRSHQKE